MIFETACPDRVFKGTIRDKITAGSMREEETKRVLGNRAFPEEEITGRKLVVHVCCAPDATAVIEWLKPLAEKLVCYFYDPNIYPPEEYIKRLHEMRKLAELWQVNMIEGRYFNAPMETVQTDFVISEEELLSRGEFNATPIAPVDELEQALRKMMEGGSYNEVIEKLKAYAGEPEGGKRCAVCFDLRLSRTAGLCKILGFDAFLTTLTISPKKNADQVNLAGEMAGKRVGAKYIWTNFKRREGFKRSVKLSKELGLYRQEYCGCKWSTGK